MLTKEQAAKYAVVGWVKDWSLITLLSAIDSATASAKDVEQERIDAARVVAPFMPDDVWVYRRGGSVRRFFADNFPGVSNALWDANSHEDRFVLAQRIERLSGAGKAVGSRFTGNDLHEMRKTRQALRQATTSYRASRDAFRSNRRSAWNVCK